MLGKGPAVGVVGVEQRGVEESAFGEGRIEGGRGVPFGENEAVTVRGERRARVDAQRSPVGGYEKVDTGE